MASAKDFKAQQIEEIKNYITTCKSMLIMQYQGISVADDTKLRTECRNENIIYKVFKNRLVAKALEELGITGFEKDLEGSSSFAFAMGEELANTRILAKACETFKTLKIKSGLIGGKYTDENTVIALSKVPTKEVLLAQFLGLLQSPMSSFARAISEVAKQKAE